MVVGEHADSRVFTCGKCGAEVVICRHCDRGNRYCSRKCSSAARRESLRRGGAAYQQTPRGKRKHAERQRRYAERRRRQAEKGGQIMTHQGSPGAGELGEMVSSLAKPALKRVSDGAKRRADEESAGPQESPGEGPPLGERQALVGKGLVRCAFCGRWCLFEGRRSLVRRRGCAGRQRRSPRHPSSGCAPPPP